MAHARAAVAADPRLFGRAEPRLQQSAQRRDWSGSDDLKLFASTFAAGFLFVSILIA